MISPIEFINGITKLRPSWFRAAVDRSNWRQFGQLVGIFSDYKWPSDVFCRRWSERCFCFHLQTLCRLRWQIRALWWVVWGVGLARTRGPFRQLIPAFSESCFAPAPQTSGKATIPEYASQILPTLTQNRLSGWSIDCIPQSFSAAVGGRRNL